MQKVHDRYIIDEQLILDTGEGSRNEIDDHDGVDMESQADMFDSDM